MDEYLADAAGTVGINALSACVLVDGGYRLRRRVLKPYPHLHALTDAQQAFNSRLSRMRAKIEHGCVRARCAAEVWCRGISDGCGSRA